MKFQVFSRQPAAAFGNWGDVPASQDKTYPVSQHKVTLGGLKNALGRRATEIREYAESYGGCAIQQTWIVLDGKKLHLDTIKTVVECDLAFDGLDQFQRQYDYANRLIDEVNAEREKQYA